MMLTAEKKETTPIDTYINVNSFAPRLSENKSNTITGTFPVDKTEEEYFDITPVSMLPKNRSGNSDSSRLTDNATIIKRIKDNAEFMANLAALGIADSDTISDLSRNIALDAALLA